MVLLPLFLACDVEVRGRVVEPGGAPVAGARLVTEAGCDAVTDADGTFKVHCPRAVYHFLVKHPTHVGATLDVDASATLPPTPVEATLRPLPSDPGLYLEPDYTALPSVPFLRKVEKTEQRFCLGKGATLATASAETTVYDIHATDWRLYPLDADGCAVKLTQAPGSRFWSPEGDPLAPTMHDDLGAGRFRDRFTLVPGRYVAVPWLDGFFVPDDPKADSWLAWGFEVG